MSELTTRKRPLESPLLEPSRRRQRGDVEGVREDEGKGEDGGRQNRTRNIISPESSLKSTVKYNMTDCVVFDKRPSTQEKKRNGQEGGNRGSNAGASRRGRSVHVK